MAKLSASRPFSSRSWGNTTVGEGRGGEGLATAQLTLTPSPRLCCGELTRQHFWVGGWDKEMRGC